MSLEAKWEYLKAIYPRYRQAGRRDKHRMLTEFCAVTGYHRKYAVRLLNGPAPAATRPARPRHRRSTYGPAVIDALTAIWTPVSVRRLEPLQEVAHRPVSRRPRAPRFALNRGDQGGGGSR